MPGLPIALVMLAQAAGVSPSPAAKAYGPVAEAPPKPPAPPPAPNERDCSQANKNPDARVIVVCGPKPQGYRLNPDVLEARREMKSGGRPKSQEQRMQQPNGCVVGPAGCQYAGINLLGAALTAAQMAERAAKGQPIGSMFQTDPHPSEYQLYIEAKKRREAKEAAAAAKAAQAKAEAQSKVEAQSNAAAGAAQPAKSNSATGP
jgi:hypothetical protein